MKWDRFFEGAMFIVFPKCSRGYVYSRDYAYSGVQSKDFLFRFQTVICSSAFWPEFQWPFASLTEIPTVLYSKLTNYYTIFVLSLQLCSVRPIIKLAINDGKSFYKLHDRSVSILKFGYSEKATKFEKIFHLWPFQNIRTLTPEGLCIMTI